MKLTKIVTRNLFKDSHTFKNLDPYYVARNTVLSKQLITEHNQKVTLMLILSLSIPHPEMLCIRKIKTNKSKTNLKR